MSTKYKYFFKLTRLIFKQSFQIKANFYSYKSESNISHFKQSDVFKFLSTVFFGEAMNLNKRLTELSKSNGCWSPRLLVR